ncbi:hypothetical protein [Sphingomonas sp. LaA6.9]|uniref:hypothetical protein n=1 Tax=Sphingomonas sp. LaA6.9 TaxID=2919914 RepID=UPI001F4FD956|nr:hypothetical protein [Sphingomonas sp. LaA6.9]MCJ8158867.1 hypothetical protein [Sphingomonas sp. LaA6.9]
MKSIEAAVAQHHDGASAAQIAELLAVPGFSTAFVHYAGRLRLTGDGRAARYHLAGDAIAEPDAVDIIPMSPQGKALLAYPWPVSTRSRPMGSRQSTRIPSIGC